MVAAIKAELKRREAEAERAETEANAVEIRLRCQTLAGFVREAWHVLEPSTEYQHNWHIDAVCKHLEAVTDGRITRLIINVPPGTMKSLLVSVLWPCWEWTQERFRPKRYLTTSFSENNAKRDTRKMRDLVQSAWFETLWPEVKLTRAGEMSFANTDTGNRECSAFASLTGQRGDGLIIDDPHSVETAESDTERENTTRRFKEGALNRLNDQMKSAIIVIMQRLHEDDLTGVALTLKQPWVHLCLPMEFEVERVADNGKTIGGPCRTYVGGELFFEDPRTREGELLDPVRFPREAVELLKADMGPYAYTGQYQQRPGPRDGSFFQAAWFKRFRPGSEPKHLRIYMTSDHAPTAGPKSDNNGVRVWGVDAGGDVWMLGGKKGRMRMDELSDHILGNLKEHERAAKEGRVLERDGQPIPKIEGLIRQWKPFAWFPEDDNNWKAVEPFVLRRAKEEGVHVRVEPISPRGADKPRRAQAAQAMAAMGRIHIPEGSEGDYAIHELVNFMTSAHDEEVDLLAVMCRALDMAHPAIVQAEAPKPEQPKGVMDMTWDQAMEQLMQPQRERI